jgi:hypothetical protein
LYTVGVPGSTRRRACSAAAVAVRLATRSISLLACALL